MHLVTIVNPPDDGTPSAVQYTQSLLKEHPTIKGIVAPTTVAIAAAAQVVDEQDLIYKYVVAGIRPVPQQMKSYVTSGTSRSSRCGASPRRARSRCARCTGC